MKLTQQAEASEKQRKWTDYNYINYLIFSYIFILAIYSARKQKLVIESKQKNKR